MRNRRASDGGDPGHIAGERKVWPRRVTVCCEPATRRFSPGGDEGAKIVWEFNLDE